MYAAKFAEAALGSCKSDTARLACMSSTSSDACQKKRYGLIVVPKMPTTTVAALKFNVSFGHTVRNATSPHGT